jgi:hypothetical protein
MDQHQVRWIWRGILGAVWLLTIVCSMRSKEDFLGLVFISVLAAVVGAYRYLTAKAPAPPPPALIKWLDEQSQASVATSPNRDCLCDYD